MPKTVRDVTAGEHLEAACMMKLPLGTGTRRPEELRDDNATAGT